MSFPSLHTMAVARELGLQRQSCSVCRLAVQPRNRDRHRKACAKRKRQDPVAWEAWRQAMHGK